MHKHAFVALAVAAGVSSLARGQTSPLYIASGSETRLIIQGGQVVGSFKRDGGEWWDGPAMAITDTIKFVGLLSPQVGRQYSLEGQLLEATYPNTFGQGFVDGTTDGASHNWTIGDDPNDLHRVVVQADLDWDGQTAVFSPTTLPDQRAIGIAYDGVNGTLWIGVLRLGDYFGVAIQQYTTDGQFVSEFPINIEGGGQVLAWDPADDTLWTLENTYNPPGRIFQFDKQGNLLQEIPIPEIDGNNEFFSGGEFSIRPPSDCYPDFTGDGVLDLFDFLDYVNAFNAGEDRADCDQEGGLDLFDFLCFTNAFNEGC
jgi:hypothetical protein